VRFVAIAALCAAAVAGAACAPRGARDARAAAPPTPPLAALAGASGWLNGPAPPESLAGRPVLLVAWSDADPRSLRLLREAADWQRAYGRAGLRVIGVHVPEFAFAADTAAPARALRRLGITLPVALDAGSRVASQLGVGDDLPDWVLVDAHGRRTLTAEGDAAARVHAALLSSLGLAPGGAAPVAPAAGGSARRVYCGTGRVPGGPLADAVPGRPLVFTSQFRYEEEGRAYTPYPIGRWTPTADGVVSARGGAADFVAMRYDGGRVDAVLGATAPARVWVMCDAGWVPAAERGDDLRVDSRGATYVSVDEPRPYALMRGGGGHVLRLSPDQPGITYYAFLFGDE